MLVENELKKPEISKDYGTHYTVYRACRWWEAPGGRNNGTLHGCHYATSVSKSQAGACVNNSDNRPAACCTSQQNGETSAAVFGFLLFGDLFSPD
jgi:hypothetical protein